MNKIELDRWPQNYGYTKAEVPLNMYFDPEAFVKAYVLVHATDLEIGWDMVIEPYKDGYKVFDVLVYPQEDSAAYVHVDLTDYAYWKASLQEETEKSIKGNGHSHVNMESFASVVDIQQQHDEVLTRNGGFCFFQIWNKKMQIVSFFYDIDNKIFYGNNDINLIVDFADGSNTNTFLAEAFKTAKVRKYIYPTDKLEEFDEFKQII